jgi:hypothetical protein
LLNTVKVWLSFSPSKTDEKACVVCLKWIMGPSSDDAVYDSLPCKRIAVMQRKPTKACNNLICIKNLPAVIIGFCVTPQFFEKQGPMTDVTYPISGSVFQQRFFMKIATASTLLPISSRNSKVIVSLFYC